MKTLTLVFVLLCSSVSASVLESPANGGLVSGIGFIAGWKCTAGTITVRIDGGAPIPVLYGNDRLDTHVSSGGPCQQRHTGYILQINWAELGDGRHTVIAYDNDRQFAASTFTVATLGESFVEGAHAEVSISDFPAPGETARFVWQEATQHLELARVVPTHVTPDPPPLPPAGVSHMYWINGWPPGRILRATLTGTQVTTILTEEQAPPQDIGMYDQLALDMAAGTLYWASKHGIYRMNLNGSQLTQIVDIVDDFDGFALDPVGGKLYWLENEVMRWANFDGSQVATFPASDPRFPPLHGLLVVDSGKLYWVDRTPTHTRRLRRANLDGTGAEVLFTAQMTRAWKEYGDVWDIEAFAVDSATGKFYWIDGSLFRANLNDGSHLERLVPRMGDGTGLALDLAGGKMYWTLWLPSGSYDSGVYRANLDGSQVEALVTGGDPGDVVLSLE